MLPNFFHIGAAKAASTFIQKMFEEHPDICVQSRGDNVNFFIDAYQKGVDWYERELYSHYNGETAVVDFSNGYMIWEPAIERITRHVPDARLTMCLRNPIDLAFLQWVQNRMTWKWDDDHPFQRGLYQMLNTGGSWQMFRLWAGPGFYGLYLERILEYFPMDRLHITLYEDLCAEPVSFIQSYYEFMGVDPQFVPEGIHTTVGFPGDSESRLNDEWRAKLRKQLEEGMPPDLRTELRGAFEEDIRKLEKILGRSFDHWV
jgi:hypothetical protein